jgi:cell wall-associated NlpC family hydrolase
LTKLRAVPSYFVFAAAIGSFALGVSGQDRQRVAKPVLSQPVNQPAPVADKTKTTLSSQPLNAPAARQPLTTDIKVSEEYKQQLVKKTVDSRPVSAMLPSAAKNSRYSTGTTGEMLNSIQSKLGIPYRYGATGPNRYDCSGFVWAVFSEAGMGFTRTSAHSLWNSSTPVEGDERYKFGTLVFFNGLGHIGIVADANGFYHASSSKGITYSTFEGYWEKRIVGFRKFDPQAAATVTASTEN